MNHNYNIDKIAAFYEEKQQRLRRFVSGAERGLITMQRVCGQQF